MIQTTIDILGWCGALIFLAAFRLHGNQKITNKTYAQINIIAGVLYIFYGYSKEAWASVIINLIFTLIAIHTVYKRKRKIK